MISLIDKNIVYPPKASPTNPTTIANNKKFFFITITLDDLLFNIIIIMDVNY